MAQLGYAPSMYCGVPTYDARIIRRPGHAPQSPRTTYRYPIAFDTPNLAAREFQPYVATRDFQYLPHFSSAPPTGSSGPWNNGQHTYSYQQPQRNPEPKSKDPPVRLSPFVTRHYPDNRFDFRNDFSAVLCAPTIFTPWHPNTAQAAWPSLEEMRYEGSDRIATDRLHRRFLCIPRVKAGNGTVNWQQRQFIKFNPLDDFTCKVPNRVDIFLRNHYIRDIEPSDEEGVRAVGAELMGML